jgi:iron complex outermembrane recepter protein
MLPMQVEKRILRFHLMFRLNKYFLFFLISLSGFGQDCNKSILGKVIDATTREALPYATVYIQELKIGTSTDAQGYFKLSGICYNGIHVKISHLGCEPLNSYVEVKVDSVVLFELHHHEELLNEMVVHGERARETLQKSSVIDRDVIFQSSETGLASLSAKVPGVSILKTGANIEKPIIQGLYGNRIAILNNGVQQAGQQWGNDHSPEIDPTMSDHLAIIKGANSLAYSGSSLGGVLMVETEKISNDPHLHGDAAYIFNSQNLSQQLSSRIEKGGEQLLWRVGLSGKVAGDSKTPNYYLTNTAKNEISAFTQIEKELGSNIQSRFIYSFYRSNLGILRGASISNLTDLKSAFTREIPFFTESERSFVINAPSQQVNHHLGVLDFDIQLPSNQKLKFKYGYQRNERNEFDVRRSNRSEIPSLSLIQTRQQLDAKYAKLLNQNFVFKAGLSYSFIDNTNQPETGILPLIPDYLSHQTGIYGILQHEIGKLETEFGLRTDFKYFDVAYISRDISRSIVRSKPSFWNNNLSGGAKYNLSTNNDITLNIGYGERAPEINELYSNGLHQGISSIEEGNPGLSPEKSFKTILSWNFSSQKKLFIQSSFYVQNIDGYIFLKPEIEPRLTIRGAFPVFTYAQTKATLAGADILASYSPSESLKLILNFAYVHGTDKGEIGGPLIFMPPANGEFSIEKTFEKIGIFKANSFQFSYQYVANQKRFSLIQDFIPPPSAYGLLNLKIGTAITNPGQNQIKAFFSIDNLLNTTYRNYLNRQRYFADEIGRNVSISLRYKF